MQLPNGDRARIDTAKLRDYCLNDSHPLGKHKARVFRSRLGLTLRHESDLREALLQAAVMENALPGECDQYGDRFVVDFQMTGPGGTGTVRSAWIILSHEDFPRLLTCYII